MWTRGLQRGFRETARSATSSAASPLPKPSPGFDAGDSAVFGAFAQRLTPSTGTAEPIFEHAELTPIPAPAAGHGIVVVGGGRMGEIRCRHISENRGASIAAFVDVCPDAGQSFSDRFRCLHFPSLDDVTGALGRQNIKGVWVCTPTPHHKETIVQAAELGLHVAVEKPVAMNKDEMRECYDACARNNVHLHCAFQRQTDPAYQRVAEAVRAGQLGDVVSAHAVFRDHPVPPIEFLVAGGGDPFHDLASHDINFILSLANERPVEVLASGRSTVPALQEAGVMDTAFVMIRFASGFLATIDLSRSSAYGYDQRFEVFGSNGQAALVDNVGSNSARFGTTNGFESSGTAHSFPQRYDEAYRIELEEFLGMIEGRRVPKVSAGQSFLTFDICEAALESVRTGTLVKL